MNEDQKRMARFLCKLFSQRVGMKVSSDMPVTLNMLFLAHLLTDAGLQAPQDVKKASNVRTNTDPIVVDELLNEIESFLKESK